MSPRLAVALLSASVLLAGCAPSASDAEKLKAQIVAADKAFCDSSKKEGPREAFLGAIAPGGKLLGDPHFGADAVRFTFMQMPSTATLTWEPAYADVSSSGDLGYTWGRYTLTFQSVVKGKPPTVRMGTYVTVWKRQADGTWKFVLDGGVPDRMGVHDSP